MTFNHLQFAKDNFNNFDFFGMFSFMFTKQGLNNLRIIFKWVSSNNFSRRKMCFFQDSNLKLNYSNTKFKEHHILEICF